MAKPRLFLDADGVLADFDAGAQRLLGMKPKAFIAKHGRGEFWKRLARAKNFYGTLPEMSDARLLFDAVKHLEPTILTGLPLGRGAAEGRVGRRAFSRRPDHHLHGRRQAQAYEARRRAGR